MPQLSDIQFSDVCQACEPLSPRDRDPFLRALVNVLRSEPQPLGDGSVHRAIKSLQREFFQPPRITNEGHTNHNRKNLGPPIE